MGTDTAPPSRTRKSCDCHDYRELGEGPGRAGREPRFQPVTVSTYQYAGAVPRKKSLLPRESHFKIITLFRTDYQTMCFQCDPRPYVTLINLCAEAKEIMVVCMQAMQETARFSLKSQVILLLLKKRPARKFARLLYTNSSKVKHYS